MPTLPDLGRFLAWCRPARLPDLPWMLQSVRFFPHWNPWSVGQIHGLIAMVLDIRSRTARHATWVEVGSLHGESATLLLAFPFVHRLHCIDPAPSRILRRRLAPFLASGRCVFHQGTSRQVADAVTDVDVAYIDADHAYEAVRDDIAVWYPKVAVGGALCGHDYHAATNVWPGVRRAVDEFVAQHRLTLTTYPDSSWMVLKTA